MTPDPDDPLFEACLVKGSPSDDAIAVGRLADLLTPMPGSLGREQLAETAQTLRDFVAEHLQHAALLQQVEGTLADVKADLQQIIDDFCDYFAELKADREAERQRIAAEEASRAELRAAMDALPDPDPDAPEGDYPAPNLEPLLRDPDNPEPQGAYAHYPDGPQPQMPGRPSELPTDRPDAYEPDASGDLPSGVGSSGILGGGTMPLDLPEDLAYPQPFKMTPTAVGGP
jgi:hypothetical protein